MEAEKHYIFGPVPSRRLGLSLGVDIIPFKICTLDCIYCQIGTTITKTCERKSFVCVENVIDELKLRLKDGIKADYITLSGSGEPTLNADLGKIILEIKKISTVPVAIITNGTLLFRADVRLDCKKADLVMPSLDAADAFTFRKINRPDADISIEKYIQGLIQFRKEYKGQFWLEVFLVDGINTSKESLQSIKDAIKQIKPDKIQLNTAVRPTAEKWVTKVSMENLVEIQQFFGSKCEIIAYFKDHQHDMNYEDATESVLSILKRRPCTIQDISSSLGISLNQAVKYIDSLCTEGKITLEQRDKNIYYKSK